MTQTIHRMYDSAERAQQAAHALQHNRFIRFAEVHCVGPDAGGQDAIVQALMQACVLKAHAQVMAPAIERGCGLVTVHAPFGSATTAIEILDEFGPVDSGLREPEDRLTPWDPATPCSHLMGLPVLVNHQDSFSGFWSLPMLSREGGTTSAALGLRELSDNTGPYQGVLGQNLLMDNPAPLSSALGLPLLKKK